MSPDPEQSRRALGQGAPTRVAMAKARKALARGELTLLDALNGNAPDYAFGVDRSRIRVLLEAVPGVGPSIALDVLERAGVDRDSKVGALGWATREQIAELTRIALEPIVDTYVEPDESWRDAKRAKS